MIIREARLGRAAVYFISVWALWFSFDVARIGAIVTSKQWVYLMEIPGGRWTWAAMFGTGAMLTVGALASRRFKLAAAGLFLIGLSCLLITAFYLLAPLIDPGLLTLGYNPWAFPGATALAFVVFVGWPIAWS